MQSAKDKKDKPPSQLNWRKLAALLLFAFVLTLVIHIEYPFLTAEYRFGDVAGENVKAPTDIIVPATGTLIKKGEIIVREGERISEAQLSALSALRRFEKVEALNVKRFFSVFLLLFLSIVIIYEYAEKNIKKFILSEKDLNFACFLTVFTLFFTKC